MSAKTAQKGAKTFDGCRFIKLGGFPCDLTYPRKAVKRGARTWTDALNQLCEKCQPHAVKS